MTIKNQIRQGDVLLHPIESIPKSAKNAKLSKRVILAHGESSGHAHSIDFTNAQMKVFLDGQQMYLRVSEPVTLKHQEHSPATIEPGDYLVKRQVEVWLDDVRQVAD